MTKGFSAIILIILICLGFVSFFALKNWTSKAPVQMTPPPAVSPPVQKKSSLREVCFDKIKNLPAPPFSYKDKKTMGTLLPLYKSKERFPNENKASACVTDYRVWDVREQAFKDMGFDYYTVDRSGNRVLNFPAVNKLFDPAVDRAYTQLMKGKGWKKVSPEGERHGGLLYIVYYKEDGAYKMYTDVTQGTDQYLFVTLTVIGQ